MVLVINYIIVMSSVQDCCRDSLPAGCRSGLQRSVWRGRGEPEERHQPPQDQDRQPSEGWGRGDQEGSFWPEGFNPRDWGEDQGHWGKIRFRNCNLLGVHCFILRTSRRNRRRSLPRLSLPGLEPPRPPRWSQFPTSPWRGKLRRKILPARRWPGRKKRQLPTEIFCDPGINISMYHFLPIVFTFWYILNEEI